MLKQKTEEIAKIIVNSAFKVHKQIGPRLLEVIYEVCLAYEIRKAGLEVKRQVDLPIIYDGITFDEGLRLDLLVEDTIIIELKSVEKINPVWQAQIISHLKLLDKDLGFFYKF